MGTMRVESWFADIRRWCPRVLFHPAVQVTLPRLWVVVERGGALLEALQAQVCADREGRTGFHDQKPATGAPPASGHLEGRGAKVLPSGPDCWVIGWELWRGDPFARGQRAMPLQLTAVGAAPEAPCASAAAHARCRFILQPCGDADADPCDGDPPYWRLHLCVPNFNRMSGIPVRLRVRRSTVVVAGIDPLSFAMLSGLESLGIDTGIGRAWHRRWLVLHDDRLDLVHCEMKFKIQRHACTHPELAR